MSKSTIEWTDETWNVTTGCTRVSAGCDNCYAVEMTKRLASIEATKEKYGGLVNEGKDHFNGVVKLHEDQLEKPLKWRNPRRVFVNSMSDLFHPEVPFEFIDKVFAVMAMSPKHTFQVLTKRPERMAEYLNMKWQADQHGFISDRFDHIAESAYWFVSAKQGKEEKRLLKNMFNKEGNFKFNWPLPNVWLGTSVENQEAADERIPHLLKCPAAVRFLSCEPLLGPVDLLRVSAEGFGGHKDHNVDCIRKGYWDDRIGFVNHGDMHDEYGDLHWVIVGGESGHNARPIHPDWVRSLRDQCKDAGVSFFFKQWGKWLSEDYFITEEKTNLINPDDSKSLYEHSHNEIYYPIGKKKSGRLLDGREWNEMPGGVSNDS